MTAERRQILELLSDAKITVEEAERLLELTSHGGAVQDRVATGPREARFLRVTIQPREGAGESGERVNVRIPLAVIRAGVNLASLLPDNAARHVNESLADKGMALDLRKLTASSADELVDALSELSVDVEDATARVKVYVE